MARKVALLALLTALGSLLLAASPALAQGVNFSPPTDFPASDDGQSSVAVGDFNGDSDPDLAVANYDGISVLLGGDKGTFGSPTNFSAGGGSRLVAVDDFDGDSDPDLAVVHGTISVLLNEPNDAPIAAVDSYTTDEDKPLTVDAATGVLSNDTDSDDDTLTIVDGDNNAENGLSPVSGPSNGSLTLDENGSFTYTPDDDFNGKDSFTYKATDGKADSDTATVSITVNPVNDAPGFTKGADQTPNEDAGTQTVTGFATNISPGPSDESTQKVSLDVTNDN